LLVALSLALPGAAAGVSTELQVRGAPNQTYQVLDFDGNVVASGTTDARGRDDRKLDLAPGEYSLQSDDCDTRVYVPQAGGRIYAPLPRPGFGRFDVALGASHLNQSVNLNTDFQPFGSGESDTTLRSTLLGVDLRYVAPIGLRGSLGRLSPFVQGGFGYGYAAKTGGLGGVPGATGVTSVGVKTDFTTHVGGGLEYETPEIPCLQRPLRLRGYGGAAWQTGEFTMSLDERQFGFPLVVQTKDYTVDSFTYGAQVGVPLCGGGCMGAELFAGAGGLSPLGSSGTSDSLSGGPTGTNPAFGSADFKGGWHAGGGVVLNFDLTF
jgi:hypothetical protein